jgi:hypothetical protein
MLGCVPDSPKDRVLPFAVQKYASPNDNLTLFNCATACAAGGYDVAGAEDAHQCFCGKSGSIPSGPYNGSCTTPCAGDTQSMCGGFGSMSLMQMACKAAEPSQGPPLPARLGVGANVAVIGELAGCASGDGSQCIARVSQLGGYTQQGTRVVTIQDAFASNFKP